MKEIKSNIYYVGVNDRNKNLFEGLWPLPNGVSYNSYLIDDEKVCLIDAVQVDFFPQFLENIREVIGDRKIDYVVINHMEPDHSGAMALVREYYPDVKVVGNKKTFGMLSGFYGMHREDYVEVRNGDTIDLGSHQLTFVMTPMVHWPETMVTLCEEKRRGCNGAGCGATTLFSGDAFGCFGALNGGIIDAEMNCDTAYRHTSRTCLRIRTLWRRQPHRQSSGFRL